MDLIHQRTSSIYSQLSSVIIYSVSAATKIPTRSLARATFLRKVYPSPTRGLVWLHQATDALPLDLFRVMVGALVFIYFLRTFFEAPDFSGPDGLIDHGLSRQLFWFTKIGLFQQEMPLWMFQAIFLLGCAFSCALIVGYRVKLFAFLIYIIAVCTYRWNFLVMYVDDSIMHLVLFWIMLLPVGQTLVLREWLQDKSGAWRRWKEQKVPGITVRCFCWNLALLYLVAGLWKWTSPMWRDGDALYVILKLPISLTPQLWKPEYLGIMKLLNYGALVLEPLFPLLFLLPKGHIVKYALLIGLLVFHVGTLVTLDIPFANIACIAAMVIPFGGELMDRMRKRRSFTTAVATRLGVSPIFAIVFVTLLTLAMVSSASLPQWRMPTRRSEQLSFHSEMAGNQLQEFRAEGLRPLQFTFFSSLWIIGIAQQYQLFNWIDERNFYPHYRIAEIQGDGRVRPVDVRELFPSSTRGVLVQFYLQGVTWMRVPPGREVELRRSLHQRVALRFCRKVQPNGVIEVDTRLERLVPDNIPTTTHFQPFMKFRCNGSEPEMIFTNLDP